MSYQDVERLLLENGWEARTVYTSLSSATVSMHGFVKREDVNGRVYIDDSRRVTRYTVWTQKKSYEELLEAFNNNYIDNMERVYTKLDLSSFNLDPEIEAAIYRNIDELYEE